MANTPSSSQPVRAWTETVRIPTYGVGEPDRNPMFLDKRVYQGSSGAVYPFPMIDRIEDEKEDRDYVGVWLENEYLRVLILPQLGGRVQMAIDKTNDFHFVYHNRVIKPALVGLTGPWISGGIEFNWPQHHRPSTFLPVDWEIEEHADGSRTVWCSEIDRMNGTKSMHGLRLAPGRAVLEVQVRLFNRTAEPQSFLWWANPAFPAGDHHQSVFPPDVRAVMDHGKRAVSEFPIATGTYYKVDYSPGTDISRYRNIPVPTSYMAFRSDFDFVGCYDHERGAGLLHVADHHVAPGKKQWTWGHGEFGRAWDRHLTDDDGPYIELMTGAFTDNQPDFTWLAPFEEKRFSQYFFPYKDIDLVKNASVEAALGLQVNGQEIQIQAYLTSAKTALKVQLLRANEVLQSWIFDASPTHPFQASHPSGNVNEADLQLRLCDSDGNLLISYAPADVPEHGIPEPATAIAQPDQLESIEALFLAGLHLEQYRHATREPADYYREGLRRDPGDARCNEALGILLYRRGLFGQAQQHFHRAVDRLCAHNPNPSRGGAHYGLGLALERQGDFSTATNAYAKASWCDDTRGPAHFALARLACRDGAWCRALQQTEEALEHQAGNLRARHLRAWLLLHQNRLAEARSELKKILASDPFQGGALFESHLLDPVCTGLLKRRLGASAHNYLELARDYESAGLFERAIAVLEFFLSLQPDGDANGEVRDCLADFAWQLSRSGETIAHTRQAADYSRMAADFSRQGAESRPDYYFPNRLESIAMLQRRMQANPEDARLPFALGNLWYSKGQAGKAIACWQVAVEINPNFATAQRNLGLAAFNALQDPSEAWERYELAFALNPSDARILFELDQLAKRLAHEPADRLRRLLEFSSIVDQRDDLTLELATLLNLRGQHREALALISKRNFHPWEGGEGKVAAQYTLALSELARAALHAGLANVALDYLQQALDWPQSLGEGKLVGHQDNPIHLLRGLALHQLGRDADANGAFELASIGISDLSATHFYNDQPAETIYSQGLALRQLKREEEAQSRFQLLYQYGEQELDQKQTIDYFAVSLPDFLVFDADLNLNHQVHCRFLMTLALVGMGREAEAVEQQQRVLQMDPSHSGARLLCIPNGQSTSKR